MNATLKKTVLDSNQAYLQWRIMPYETRKQMLLKYQNLLIQHQDECTNLIVEEVKKPVWEAKTEVASMIKKIELSILAYETQIQNNEKTRFYPLGCCVILGPFNLPGHLPNGQIVPLLLAGNTVIFKPSEYTPKIGQKMIEYLWESGIPKPVVQLVLGNGKTGQALLDIPEIAGVFFTGSAATGRHIHRLFGGQPEKLLVLEMGGNNPLVIDLENLGLFDNQTHQPNVKKINIVLELIIRSAFITSGQRCTCARRLILIAQHEIQVRPFLNRLTQAVQDIKTGIPKPVSGDCEPEPIFMGPVISDQAAAVIQAQYEKLLNLKKFQPEILVPLKAANSVPALLSPGVIFFHQTPDVNTKQFEIFDQEIFGPVLQVFQVPDLNTAIQLSNQTRYGLSAGIITERKQDYEHFRDQVRAGIINWNQPLTGASGTLPFGGVGWSGNFKPGGFSMGEHCTYPVASLTTEILPENLSDNIPGIR